ncbi:unnamed protein product [Sympodiomycopsis kandeliae]
MRILFGLFIALAYSWPAEAGAYPIQPQGLQGASNLFHRSMAGPYTMHWSFARGNMGSKSGGGSGCCSKPSTTSPPASPAHPAQSTPTRPSATTSGAGRPSATTSGAGRPSATTSAPRRQGLTLSRPLHEFQSIPQGHQFGYSSASGSDPDSKSSGKTSPASSVSSDFSHGPVRAHTPSPPVKLQLKFAPDPHAKPPAAWLEQHGYVHSGISIRPPSSSSSTSSSGANSPKFKKSSGVGPSGVKPASPPRSKGKAAAAPSASSSSSSSPGWKPPSDAGASGTRHSPRDQG